MELTQPPTPTKNGNEEREDGEEDAVSWECVCERERDLCIWSLHFKGLSTVCPLPLDVNDVK